MNPGIAAPLPSTPDTLSLPYPPAGAWPAAGTAGCRHGRLQARPAAGTADCGASPGAGERPSGDGGGAGSWSGRVPGQAGAGAQAFVVGQGPAGPGAAVGD